MKSTLTVIGLLFSLIILSACNGNNQTEESQSIPDSVLADTTEVKNPVASVQEKLEQERMQKLRSVPGSYMGVLPCADCEGIKTMVVLNEDNSYLKKTARQGKKERIVNENKGTYTYDAVTRKIALVGDDGESFYLFQESHIIQLDKKGNEIKTDKPEMYWLKKMAM